MAVLKRHRILMIRMLALLFHQLLIGTIITAQPSMDQISGSYYLEGVAEVASGFQLNADQRFEFFFSYGGLDRFGRGTWRLDGNNIVFESEPWPGSDFKLVKQGRSKKQEGSMIKITDANTFLTGYVGCIMAGEGRIEELQSDQDGIATSSLKTIDSITLYHLFYSDQLSVFPVENAENNQFEFTFLPHLGTVYFRNFNLLVIDRELAGGHPLLEKGKIYYYRKAE